MKKLGDLVFLYRNFMFPVFYAFLFIPTAFLVEDYQLMLSIGFGISLLGTLFRWFAVGLSTNYIIRGGQDRKVYAENLITDGLYAHSRNPLYVGNVLLLVGLGIMSNSAFFNFFLSPLFILFYSAIIRAEEAYLIDKFGDPYLEYKKDSNRWLPRLKGMSETLKNSTFRWKRVLIKEYTPTYIWSSAVVIVFAKINLSGADEITFALLIPYIIALIGLGIVYLFVRYLKKSKKVTDS